VFNYGLSDIGVETGIGPLAQATLASRVLAGPWTNFVLCNVRTHPAGVLMVRLPNTAQRYYGFAAVFAAAGLHFPYGFDVDPDVHG